MNLKGQNLVVQTQDQGKANVITNLLLEQAGFEALRKNVCLFVCITKNYYPCTHFSVSIGVEISRAIRHTVNIFRQADDENKTE